MFCLSLISLTSGCMKVSKLKIPFSREHNYNSKSICMCWKLEAKDIYFLFVVHFRDFCQRFFQICVKSFFKIVFRCVSCWIQKVFVLRTWGQGHLFSFCRTERQLAFSWFASKVFLRSLSTAENAIIMNY